MKKIIISDDRKLNISNVVVGYLQENKIEKLEFEIPKEYENFGRKACFDANGNTFAKTFDNITGNTITLTRDITQYQDLFMTIAFFKIEDEDEIIARTSTLHILIQDAVICDDDIKPDDPKVVILDNLITKVTNLDNTVTKNEEIREANETTRQQNETTREENEINRVNSEANREKAEESRKKAELERVSNENTRQSNEEERKAAENERVSNENAREEYINNLKAQVDNGDFDGADFNYKWDGTKLGVKNSKETTYQYVELKGQKGDKGGKGDKGDTGNGIQNIEKVSTVGNVDTYVINYTDGTQTTFDVTNGEVTKEQLDEVDNKAKNTRNELERVKNDVLETGTDTDTFIHLEDSAMAEYQELSVDGVCEQETTTGKNLLDYVSNLITSANGLTNVINEDGSITTTGKPTSNYSTIIKTIDITDILEDGQTYTISQGNASNIVYVQIAVKKVDGTFARITSARGSKSFEVNKTIYTNYSIMLQTNTISSWGDSSLTITNKYMLCKGTDTADTSFEPYTGGQPSPSPDYPQEIKTITDSLSVTSCNKNLFGTEWEKYARNNTDGNSTVYSDKYIRTKNPILVKPNNVYSFKVETEKVINGADIHYYDINKNFIGRDSIDTIFTKTIPNNCHYINIQLYCNIGIIPSDINTTQLEKGSTPTPYEQHLETQIEANLPEGEFVGKIGDIKDTLNVVYKEDGQYHLNLYKRVYKNNSYNGESYNYYISTTARKDGNIECGELQTGQVVYYGGDETIIDLGIVDQLITYNEITNLFTDSDLLPTINAKYYRNFISTVRNLQVNEKALKQELIDINNRLSALENANVVDNNPTEESEATNDIQVQ